VLGNLLVNRLAEWRLELNLGKPMDLWRSVRKLDLEWVRRLLGSA